MWQLGLLHPSFWHIYLTYTQGLNRYFSQATLFFYHCLKQSSWYPLFRRRNGRDTGYWRVISDQNISYTIIDMLYMLYTCIDMLHYIVEPRNSIQLVFTNTTSFFLFKFIVTMSDTYIIHRNYSDSCPTLSYFSPTFNNPLFLRPPFSLL